MNISPGQQFKRTRIAPTPSGFLHLGNLYSFIITTRIAKKTGAKVLLRIDDMDQERARPECIMDIFDTLYFMGISWDEGPVDYNDFQHNYSQVHRSGHYQRFLDQLRHRNLVYACTCSRSQIKNDSKSGHCPNNCRSKNLSTEGSGIAWRLHTAKNESVLIKNLGETAIGHSFPEQMRDLVIRRKDGFAAYQLSSVADDVFFDVDLVVRGADLWHSTIAQVYLAGLIDQKGFANATFHHHPLLKDSGGNKMSKSKGSASIRSLRNQGLSATDIYNLLDEVLQLNNLNIE